MLSFNGKVNRTKYWVANLLIMPALSIVAFVTFTFAFDGVAGVLIGGAIFGLAAALMYLIFIFPFLSLLIIGISPSESK